MTALATIYPVLTVCQPCVKQAHYIYPLIYPPTGGRPSYSSLFVDELWINGRQDGKLTGSVDFFVLYLASLSFVFLICKMGTITLVLRVL